MYFSTGFCRCGDETTKVKIWDVKLEIDIDYQKGKEENNISKQTKVNIEV